MNLVYRFRLYPNKVQKELFSKTFGCVRFVYNRMLAEKNDHYKKTGKMLSVTPAKYKKEFPWLKEVDSLALCNAQMHLQAAYRNFFRDPAVGFPKFKSKKAARKSYTTNSVNGNVALENGKLKLPKAGWVRIRQHRKIRDDLRLKGATVSMEANGQYYVSLLYFCCEEPEPISLNPEKSAGLDFSVGSLYVSSDGMHADYPHYFCKAQEKLAKAQRKLSRCKKGSHRYEKQKQRVSRIHAHIANQRKDFLHKESRKITNSWDIVCIEDLDIKAMSQELNLGKRILDTGWRMFTAFLSYKLEQAGKKLVKISRWYASSKRCSCCGRIKQDLRLDERVYRCACGNVMDRDENAAVNIRREGLRMLTTATA